MLVYTYKLTELTIMFSSHHTGTAQLSQIDPREEKTEMCNVDLFKNVHYVSKENRDLSYYGRQECKFLSKVIKCIIANLLTTHVQTSQLGNMGNLETQETWDGTKQS